MTGQRPWKGFFVTLEGGEGGGKSTQSQRLATRLREAGETVVQTREPGGVEQAESLRHLLMSGDPERWSPISEALMMYAARVEHWRLKIRPALDEGHCVVCDRFSDSTMAYQGLAGGVGKSAIMAIHQAALGSVSPDLTFILDVLPQTGMARVERRLELASETATRFERKGPGFHERLRLAYLAIAREAPARCRVIDASADPDTVASHIWKAVAPRLGLAA